MCQVNNLNFFFFCFQNTVSFFLPSTYFLLINLFFIQVQINSRKAQTLYSNVDRTTQGAKELDTKIKNVIWNVHGKKSYSAQLNIFYITLQPLLYKEKVQHYEKEPVVILKNQYEPSIKISAFFFVSSLLESRIPSSINCLMFFQFL